MTAMEGAVNQPRPFTLPPACQPGDKVAIVAPSSNVAPLFPKVHQLGLRRLREVFDLEPVEFPTTQMMTFDITARPEARAEDIMRAFEDPTIKAVISTIGGDDQLTVLKYLEPEVLRAHPTRFFGYSDNTNLCLYLWKQGIVSYYGGALMTQLAMPGAIDPFTLRYLKWALFGDSFGALEPSKRVVEEIIDWTSPRALGGTPKTRPNSEGWVWHNPPEGKVSGRLWGGCLAILEWQFQLRRYLPPFEQLEGAVLLLETSEVMPEEFRVRMFLSILGELGLLERFSAVLVGRPMSKNRQGPPPEGEEDYIRAQRDAITGAVRQYAPGLPVVFNVDVGHTNPQIAIPLGGVATLDGVQRSIRVDYG